MSYAKVIINFSTSKYTDLELIAKGGVIVEHLTNNPRFPTPFPFLAELIDVIAQFNAAYLKAEDGSKGDTAVKNNLRVGFEFLLRKIALYVETETAGDETAILSAGFDTRKKPEPVGPLDNATGLIIRYGQNSGEVTMECDALKNTLMYEFQFTTSPVSLTSVWTNVSSTKRKVSVSGLSRGVEYVFRVAGMNTNPARNWSEPVIKLVV